VTKEWQFLVQMDLDVHELDMCQFLTVSTVKHLGQTDK